MIGSHATAAASAAEGWRALDALLDETERSAVAECAEADFYQGLFARLAALGSAGAAVWRLQASQLECVWRSSLEEPSVVTAELLQSDALQRIGASFVVPWKTSERSFALEARFPPTAVADGLPAALAALAPVLTAYCERREQRELRERLQRQTKFEAFALSLCESLDPTEVADRIANDGRSLIGCERVAVAVRRGKQHRLLAVSGAEHLHRRSETVRQLEALCAAVAADDQPLWSQDKRDLPPQLETAIGDYLDESPATALAVLPLGKVGMLVCEQYSGEFDAALRAQIAALPRRCTPPLSAALQVAAIPGNRTWLALARDGRLQTYANRTALIAAAVVVILATLLLIPAQVRVKARGELQPTERRDVFAPHDAVVTNVFVDHGAAVEAGETLLELRSPDLELERQKTAGELETVRKQLAAAQAEQLQIRPGDAEQRGRQRRLTAEIQQFEEQIRGLDARQAMLDEQRAALTVKSPLGGTVVTWNARERLAGRPLRRGDALLMVADESGPWQVELRVPARGAGRVLAAPAPATVDFVVTTNPGRSLTGTVRSISDRVETDESGESYLSVLVDVPRDELPARTPGAVVVARLHTGRSSLAVAWFHELWDAVRLWTMF